jgi:hypothetical protein
VIGIALLVAGITRISRADDGRDFATKSQFTKIEVPGAVNGTQPLGINPQGDIVGSYIDSGFNFRGFLVSKGRFTNIDVPAAFGTQTQAAGINPQGDIVGTYSEGSSGISHGFLLTKEWLKSFSALRAVRAAPPSYPREPAVSSRRSESWFNIFPLRVLQMCSTGFLSLLACFQVSLVSTSAQQALKAENHGGVAFLYVPPGSRVSRCTKLGAFFTKTVSRPKSVGRRLAA